MLLVMLYLSFFSLLFAFWKKSSYPILLTLPVTVITFYFFLLVFAEISVISRLPFVFSYFAIFGLSISSFWWLPSGATTVLTKASVTGERTLAALITVALLMFEFYDRIAYCMINGILHSDILNMAIPQGIALITHGINSIASEYPHYFFGFDLIAYYFIYPSTSLYIYNFLFILPFISFIFLIFSFLPSNRVWLTSLICFLLLGFSLPWHNWPSKNDITTAAFLASGVLFIYQYIADKFENNEWLFLGAMSLCLGAAIKPHSLIIASSVLIFIAYYTRKRDWKPLLIAALVCTIVLSLWLYRFVMFENYSPAMKEVSQLAMFFPTLATLNFNPGTLFELTYLPLLTCIGLFLGVWITSLPNKLCIAQQKFILFVTLVAFLTLFITPYLIINHTTYLALQLRLANPFLFLALIFITYSISSRDYLPISGILRQKIFGMKFNSIVSILLMIFLAISLPNLILKGHFLFEKANKNQSEMNGYPMTKIGGHPTKIYNFFSNTKNKRIYIVGLLSTGFLGSDFSNTVDVARLDDFNLLDQGSEQYFVEWINNLAKQYDYIAVEDLGERVSTKRFKFVAEHPKQFNVKIVYKDDFTFVAQPIKDSK